MRCAITPSWWGKGHTTHKCASLAWGGASKYTAYGIVWRTMHFLLIGLHGTVVTQSSVQVIVPKYLVFV